jgi:23S rRNA pseudouridine2605 synthase
MAPNNRFRNSSSEGRNKPFKKSNNRSGKEKRFDKGPDQKFSKPASKGKSFGGRNEESKKRFSAEEKPRGRREDFREKGPQRSDEGFSGRKDYKKGPSSEEKPRGRREDFREKGPYKQKSNEGFSERREYKKGPSSEGKPRERREDFRGKGSSKPRPESGFSSGKESGKGFFKKPRWKKEGDSSPRGDERGGYTKPRSFGDKDNSFRKRGIDSGKPYESGDRKEKSDSGERKSYSRREPSQSKPFVESRVEKQRKSNTGDAVSPQPQGDLIRLNKYISNSGVCSRREADELIAAGLITVNGNSVTELGYKVKATDDVRYEGKKLKAEKPVYILLNKPKGFITTTDDPQERKTVMQLIHGACRERVYPVGRLDRNTSGLLLLTNDGDLTEKLSHPSHNVKKIYKAELDRPLEKNDFQKILNGIHLEEGKAMVDDLAIVSDDGKTVGLELHIGWNRIVRRIFESLGYEVVKLDRSVYATLDKKELPRGHWRFLREEEIIRLKHFQ